MKLNKSLISGSLILLIAFNIYNALNFIFQFSMARFLSVSEYGTLATLFAIIYILSVFTEGVQTILAKYSSNEKSPGKIKNLLIKSIKKSSIISAILFIVYLAISFPLSSLLKVDYSLLALNGLVIITSFLVPVTRGIMLGKKKFKSLGINLITESSVKLVFAILLVLIGWKVYGAIAAVVVGGSVAFIMSFRSLKFIIKSNEKKSNTLDIYHYSKPVIFLMFIIIAFYSIDVLIAKIVFPEEIAGYYALVSVLGKAIFWGTQPISRAMFPLSAEKKSKSRGILYNSLALVISLIAIALILFYLFPELILKIFSGKSDVSQASQILFFVGIAFSLQALTNIVILYKLSKENVSNYLYFILFILLEVILLLIFSDSLIEFSLAYVASSAIFLIGSLLILKIKR
jgi:O-antigen/teichoic acid export membrane protein